MGAAFTLLAHLPNRRSGSPCRRFLGIYPMIRLKRPRDLDRVPPLGYRGSRWPLLSCRLYFPAAQCQPMLDISHEAHYRNNGSNEAERR